MNKENDAVNHPSHYTSSPAKCKNCGQQIECIDITEHMAFNTGNAVKYIWRMDLKKDSIEDLRKAAWYINREIEKREYEVVSKTKSGYNYNGNALCLETEMPSAWNKIIEEMNSENK